MDPELSSLFLGKTFQKFQQMELKTKMFWPDGDTYLDVKRDTDNQHVKTCSRCEFRLLCPGILKGYISVHGEDEIEPIKRDVY